MSELRLDNLDKSDWPTYRFDQIAEHIRETVDPKTTELEVYIGLEHLDPESLHIRRHGERGDVSGGKLRCYPGDVIFGKRRAYQRKAAIVDVDAFCSAHSMVLRAKPEVIDPRLFPFFLHSDSFMHRAVDISVGSLSPTINWTALKKQEFQLPPKDQQAKLAELLWAGEKNKRCNANLLARLAVATKSCISDELRTHSVKWKSLPLGDLVEIITGKLDSNASVNNGRYPFFTCDPATLHIDTYSFDCEALLLAGNNASGVYPIKHYKGRFDAYQRTYVITIRNEENLSYQYLLEVLKTQLDLLKRISVGSSTKFLTMGMLKNLQIPLPPTTEQDQTVKHANRFNASQFNTATAQSGAQMLQSNFQNRIF